MIFQMAITIGILVADVANYFFAKLEWGWRLSLGCAAVPALIFIIGSWSLPDTPNSLIERGNHEEAKNRLQKFRGKHVDIEEEFNDLVLACEEAKKIKNPWINIFRKKYRPQLTFAILLPAFQQLTGMNVYMFYAPVLFRTIGFGMSASLMSALITGGVNAASTVVSIATVDKFGRRFLFLEGGIQMIICQVLSLILNSSCFLSSFIFGVTLTPCHSICILSSFAHYRLLCQWPLELDLEQVEIPENSQDGMQYLLCLQYVYTLQATRGHGDLYVG